MLDYLYHQSRSITGTGGKKICEADWECVGVLPFQQRRSQRLALGAVFSLLI
jgi:hypothetical protein